MMIFGAFSFYNRGFLQPIEKENIYG